MNYFYAKPDKQCVRLEFDNSKQLSDYLKTVEGKSLIVKIERETGVRSGTQNNAIHKYFEMLSAEFNAAGIDVQLFLKQTVDIDFTPALVKELLWRPVQKALTQKESTTQLDKASDISEVYDHITRHLGEKFEIFVPFPSEQNKHE